MSPRTRRLLKIGTGWLFLILGVAGLFLPFLQGVLFLAVGLVILAQEQAWAHRLMMRIRHRFPRMAQVFDSAHAQAEAWIRKWRSRKPSQSPPDQ